jgi:hypothetical protein
MRIPPRKQPSPPKVFLADRDFTKDSPTSAYFLHVDAVRELRPNTPPAKVKMYLPPGSYVAIAQVNLINPSANIEIPVPFFECTLSYPSSTGRSNSRLSGQLPRREDMPPYQVLLNACISSDANLEIKFVISLSQAKDVVISAENLRLTAIRLPSVLALEM